MRSTSATELPPKGELKNLIPLLRYLKPYLRQVLGAGIALIFTSSAVLGMGAGLRYLVDEGLSKGDQHLLDRAFLIMLGVIVLLSLTTAARYYLISWIGERTVADIRRDLYAKLLSMHVGFFETNSTGELLSRLTTDTTLLQTVIGSTVSIALRNMLLLIGGFGLLLFTSAELTGYVSVIMPLVVLPIIVLGRRVRMLSRDTQKKVAEMNAHAEESLNAIRTLKSLTLEAYESWRFTQKVNGAMQTALGRILTRAGLIGSVIFLIFGAVASVMWIGGRNVLKGTISPGELSAFVFYSVVVAGAVGALSEVVAELQRAAGAAERLKELLSLEPELAAPPHPSAIPDPSRSSITFEQVSFAYPARKDQSALNQVNLTIQPGERIAFVGPSGAGKTTIFQLLQRFYDPLSGKICIGGTDLRELDPVRWRGCLGIVPQEPVLFTASAMENIRLGRQDATDDEVKDAARAAAAYDFIQSMPEGFATHLGEKGMQLSGGQRQRLAIARAVLRNPAILLLDEATSALDAENEHLIQQALERLMQGRTTLIIAHRLSTVMHADRIVLMNEGKIEAIAPHAELLQKSPLYARLASLQLAQAA